MRRRRVRPSSSPCRAARVRIAWCMVGTAVYQVGRTSSSQWKKRSALNPGEQCTCAPAASEESTAAIRPWMWKSGMMFRQTSSGVSCSAPMMFRAEAVTLRWSSGTIFGREVDPEVCSTRATSSGCASPPSNGPAPFFCKSRSEKAPAPWSRWGTRSMVGMRSLVATARAGESRPTSTTSALARRSVRLNSNSSAVRPRLSGAVVAPAPIARNAVAASGPLGRTSTTRSPRPIPKEFSSATVRSINARRSRYRSGGTASGAPIAAASSAPRCSNCAIVSMYALRYGHDFGRSQDRRSIEQPVRGQGQELTEVLGQDEPVQDLRGIP